MTVTHFELTLKKFQIWEFFLKRRNFRNWKREQQDERRLFKSHQVKTKKIVQTVTHISTIIFKYETNVEKEEKKSDDGSGLNVAQTTWD